MTVGNIVTLLGVYHSSVFDLADLLNIELTELTELLEPLRYCAERRCVQDQPEHFCHVCTLEPPDDDEDLAGEEPQINGWELASTLLPTTKLVIERFEAALAKPLFKK